MASLAEPLQSYLSALTDTQAKGDQAIARRIEQIERSVYWHRLLTLHRSLPRQYKDPRHLYVWLKQSIAA